MKITLTWTEVVRYIRQGLVADGYAGRHAPTDFGVATTFAVPTRAVDQFIEISDVLPKRGDS